MEQAISTVGRRHAIPQIVVGGLILAAVTSLPNAVAGVYLAGRGRGAATLSTAMNSNALNVTVGLLLPGAIVGVGASSVPVTAAAVWYLALTSFVLVSAYLARGPRRAHGLLILCAYLAFAGVMGSSAYSSTVGLLLSIAIPAAAATAVIPWLPRKTEGHDGRPQGERTNSPRTEPTRRHDESLVAGWSIRRVWYMALALSSLIAAGDAILGHQLILIGLLVAGPCCALLTGRWARTGAAGALAIGLAVLLGLPDGIWGTTTHLVFLGTVVIVAIVTTSSGAAIERHQ